MGVVYCLTAPCGTKYVGATDDYARRMRQHALAVKKTGVSAAIRMYGWEAMTSEILESDLESSDLFDAEIKWIDQLNTMHPNGYNLTRGGDDNPMNHEVNISHHQASVDEREQDVDYRLRRLQGVRSEASRQKMSAKVKAACARPAYRQAKVDRMKKGRAAEMARSMNTIVILTSKRDAWNKRRLAKLEGLPADQVLKKLKQGYRDSMRTSHSHANRDVVEEVNQAWRQYWTDAGFAEEFEVYRKEREGVRAK